MNFNIIFYYKMLPCELFYNIYQYMDFKTLFNCFEANTLGIRTYLKMKDYSEDVIRFMFDEEDFDEETMDNYLKLYPTQSNDIDLIREIADKCTLRNYAINKVLRTTVNYCDHTECLIHNECDCYYNILYIEKCDPIIRVKSSVCINFLFDFSSMTDISRYISYIDEIIEYNNIKIRVTDINND